MSKETIYICDRCKVRNESSADVIEGPFYLHLVKFNSDGMREHESIKAAPVGRYYHLCKKCVEVISNRIIAAANIMSDSNGDK